MSYEVIEWYNLVKMQDPKIHTEKKEIRVQKKSNMVEKKNEKKSHSYDHDVKSRSKNAHLNWTSAG